MTSTNSTAAPANVSDRELTLTRVFDAPRRLVYRAWTDPAHVANWWLPGPGFTVPVCEIDARPGGVFRVDMRGPDGMLYPNNGLVFEAIEPERVVFSLVLLDDASHAIMASLNTIAFEEQGDRTRIIMHTRLVHVAPEASEAVAGMEEGWNNCLARLDERVAAIRAGADTAPEDEQFVYTREFDAPRDVVFTAWTGAERLAKWFGPAGMDMLRCSIDLRPGGIFHYGMRAPDGQSMWGKWTFREIAPPGLLEFIVSFSDEQCRVARHPMSDTWPLQVLSTIRFEDLGRRTRVTMTASPLGANETERQTFIENKGSMMQGWNGTAAQLDAYLKSA
jgi:uncharacterized protein YndB with AHSA1/START domain